MSLIDWLVTLIPFSLILVMAVRSGRYVRGVADFLAAGRCAGRYVMCVGDLTAGLSVITLVAMVEANYQVGCALSFWNFFNVLAGIATTLTGYCVYRYRATRALSFGQFLEMRYNRTVRIVAAIIRNVAEMITNAIGPAIAAGFFVYFLGLSRYVNILGFQISTVGIIVAICLFLAMLCIWPGGRVSLLLTDCAQGIMTYPIFVIISIFILCKFSWFEEIAPVMMDRVDGESFLNPFDIENLREFNLFSTTVAVFGNILNRAAWFGNDTTNSGRTPHEQKMAGILGYWRNGFSYIMMTLVALMIITYMNHKDFSQDSYEVRNALSAKVTEELIPDRELQEKINTTIAAIPPHTHTIGVDAPLSQASNLDTPYYDTFRNLLTELPEDHELYEQRFKLSQRYRSTYNQMMTPVVLRKLFPVGLGGLFCLLMLMLLISTDDSRIFNASSTLVQDCIMPFVKKPWTTKQHIMWLRLASVAVALFFFVVAIFFQNLDFINMFTTIMCSLWLGGAGPIMIGGLYTRFGNTTGAVCSLIFGCGSSLLGLVAQRCWADHIYLWLEKHNYVEAWDKFFRTVSAPFNPYIDWCVIPDKFPLNSFEIYFISMVLSILAYCIGSWVTYKGPYNLDRLLHRGKYSVGESTEVKEQWSFSLVIRKLVGIDHEYTRGDKVIAWSVFAYAFVYQLVFLFLIPLICNLIPAWRWDIRGWGWYFFISQLVIGIAIGCVSTVWFCWGGLRDGKQLLKDLEKRINDPLDDGTVVGNVSRADMAKFDKKDNENQE